MALWDASIQWVTLVIRAPDGEEARRIAVEEVMEMGLFETTFDVPALTDDWPRRLDPEGPAEILLKESN
jgi:hypothetical protein